VVDGRTVASASVLEGEARVVELARMLAGRPGSAAARRHAEELLQHTLGSAKSTRR
jgi:DNA repair ATPase RecN